MIKYLSLFTAIIMLFFSICNKKTYRRYEILERFHNSGALRFLVVLETSGNDDDASEYNTQVQLKITLLILRSLATSQSQLSGCYFIPYNDSLLNCSPTNLQPIRTMISAAISNICSPFPLKLHFRSYRLHSTWIVYVAL